jgi:hypothetical protein
MMNAAGSYTADSFRITLCKPNARKTNRKIICNFIAGIFAE